jgi:flagellar biosynthesis protein FliP
MSRFSVIRSALFISIILLAALRESMGTKQMKQTNFRKTIARAALSSFLIGSQITNVMPARAVETTFQQQLKVIQALQVEQQKINVQMATNKGVVGDSDAGMHGDFLYE